MSQIFKIRFLIEHFPIEYERSYKGKYNNWTSGVDKGSPVKHNGREMEREFYQRRVSKHKTIPA